MAAVGSKPAAVPQVRNRHRCREAAAVDAARLTAADSDAGNWMSYGRTYDEQRFSPLNQINDQNVGAAAASPGTTTSTPTAARKPTPLVVDGVLYVTTAWSKVNALDAAHRQAALGLRSARCPASRASKACCDVVNRGVAVWKGKVYVGTLDGRLIALDAETGKPVWSVQTTDPEQLATPSPARRAW